MSKFTKFVSFINDLPARGLLGLVKLVSPFYIKNEYVREVYTNNINLFRVHLLLALLLVSPVIVVLAVYNCVVVIVSTLIELCGDFKYEFKSISKIIARGFEQGLPRD